MNFAAVSPPGNYEHMPIIFSTKKIRRPASRYDVWQSIPRKADPHGPYCPYSRRCLDFFGLEKTGDLSGPNPILKRMGKT
jgi:hypothetical protein